MEAKNLGHELVALFLVLLCFSLAFHGPWRGLMDRFSRLNALWGRRERRMTRRVRNEFPQHVKLLLLATLSSCLPPFTMDKMAANLDVATGQGARPAYYARANYFGAHIKSASSNTENNTCLIISYAFSFCFMTLISCHSNSH